MLIVPNICRDQCKAVTSVSCKGLVSGAKFEARIKFCCYLDRSDLGLTISQWDDLPEHDRSWALAADFAESQLRAEQCEACGGPKAECQNADSQHAYEVAFRRCYRTQAVARAQKARTDHDVVLTVVTLNPALKKSAQPKKRVAPRG